MWDASGDPCPVLKYEWAVEQTDGKVIQNFTEIGNYICPFTMMGYINPNNKTFWKHC